MFFHLLVCLCVHFCDDSGDTINFYFIVLYSKSLKSDGTYQSETTGLVQWSYKWKFLLFIFSNGCPIVLMF